MKSEHVTVADLIFEQAEISAHCRDCGHWRILQPGQLPLHLQDVSVPDLDGRFRCGHCGSINSCAMPLYPSQKRPLRQSGRGWIEPPAQ